MKDDERAKVIVSAMKEIMSSLEEIREEIVAYQLLDDETVDVNDKLFTCEVQLQDITKIIDCYTDSLDTQKRKETQNENYQSLCRSPRD